MKGFLIVCGVLSSFSCFFSGLYLLGITAAQQDSILVSIAHGIGIYFIGNSFFVGPVLIVMAYMTSNTLKTAA